MLSFLKKGSLMLLLAGSLMGCQPEEVATDCVEQPRSDVGCIALYDPVCGCNGKTYSNGCEAQAAGITRFTKGACAGAD